jgi:hypothetical protein
VIEIHFGGPRAPLLDGAANGGEAEVRERHKERGAPPEEVTLLLLAGGRFLASEGGEAEGGLLDGEGIDHMRGRERWGGRRGRFVARVHFAELEGALMGKDEARAGEGATHGVNGELGRLGSGGRVGKSGAGLACNRELLLIGHLLDLGLAPARRTARPVPAGDLEIKVGEEVRVGIAGVECFGDREVGHQSDDQTVIGRTQK